jgi:hypothetical protein
MAALIDALRGEVDPRTLEISVEGRDEATRAVEEQLEAGGGTDVTRAVGDILEIRIRYQLAALGEREEHLFRVGEAGIVDG